MAYVTKYVVNVAAASSATFGQGQSTDVQPAGFLEAVQYIPDPSNPFVAGSSAVFLVRSDSTLGMVICRTSSGLAGNPKMFFPRRQAHNSTSGAVLASSSLRARIPLSGEILYVVRKASSTGSTMGGKLNVFVGG